MGGMSGREFRPADIDRKGLAWAQSLARAHGRKWEVIRPFQCREHGCRVRFAALVAARAADGTLEGAVSMFGPFDLDTSGADPQSKYVLTGEPQSGMGGLVLPLDKIPGPTLSVVCHRGHVNEMSISALQEVARAVII